MFPCVNVPLYVRLGFFHNADLQTLGWNGLWWCDSCRCYHMENSVWQCAECVSRSDGRCLFVLCTKRSASVSACWDVRHLMTLSVCLPGRYFVNRHLCAGVCACCQLDFVGLCVHVFLQMMELSVGVEICAQTEHLCPSVLFQSSTVSVLKA